MGPPGRTGPSAASRGRTGRPAAGGGFTFLEIVVVVAIIAVIMAVAHPDFRLQRVAARLAADARSLEGSLNRARSLALTTRAPVRLVIDCSKGAGGCASIIQVPVLDGLRVDGWRSLGRELRRLSLKNAVATAARAPAHDGARRRPGIFWAIFLPDGRALSDPRPFALEVSDGAAGGGRSSPAGLWRVTVTADSGRILAARVEK